MTFWIWLFGIMTVASGLGVVFARKPLNSALWLVLTLFFVAVHFALLRADFLAVLQVLIYAGAIMVLVVFVIMLLGVDEDVAAARWSEWIGFGAVVATGLFVAMLYVAFQSELSWPIGQQRPIEQFTSVNGAEIGRELFTRFAVPFQLIGFLLLTAVIGAVTLALDPKRPLRPGRGLRAKQVELGKPQQESESN